MPKPVAIYLPHAADFTHFLKDWEAGKISIDLPAGQGAFFTPATLTTAIRAEQVHGISQIQTHLGNSLIQASEGEQKKALLLHLIAKQPSWILVSNVLDNLDASNAEWVHQHLQIVSQQCMVIQVLTRRTDQLPFIDHCMVWEEGRLHHTPPTLQPLVLGTIPSPLCRAQPFTNPLVECNDVTVFYQERCIVRDINWTIQPNECWQLKGPNGSGKTTLLSMINGDNPKAYGQSMRLFGFQKGTGESIWDIKQHIGYFSSAMMRGFERYDTPLNMITGGLYNSIGLYQTPGDAAISLAREWMQLVAPDVHNHQPFLQFAPAQQRMILIARAMIKHPPLLLLDEPTAGLDDQGAALVVALINQIATQTATSMVVVSHRKEPGLHIQKVFELEPHADGSTGRHYTMEVQP